MTSRLRFFLILLCAVLIDSSRAELPPSAYKEWQGRAPEALVIKVQSVSRRETMTIPTEPIGSIPRPIALIEAIKTHGSSDPALDPMFDEAIRDTIARFEATGSPVITDGEQRKYHNFGTYCVDGLPNIAPDGFKLPFIHHTRQWPRLTRGPFRYLMSVDRFIDVAKRYAHVPLKQAVISPSALSLMYPAEPIPDYSRDEFIDDLLNEHENEIRSCLDKGVHNVQIDFTEGRLAVKLDPSGERAPGNRLVGRTHPAAAGLSAIFGGNGMAAAWLRAGIALTIVISSPKNI